MSRPGVLRGAVADAPASTSFFVVPEDSGSESLTTSRDVKENLLEVFKPSKCALRINKIFLASNKGIRIDAENPDIESLKSCSELTRAGLKVVERNKLSPRLIVYGIPKGMTRTEIQEELISQNLDNHENTELEVKYVFPARPSKNFTHCVIQVSPQVRNVFIKRQRIYLRYSSCGFEDYVRILQCYRCLALGHLARDCESVPVCGHCMDEHEMKDCDRRNAAPKCYNCKKRNISSACEDHLATDFRKCPLLIRRKENSIANTNYG